MGKVSALRSGKESLKEVFKRGERLKFVFMEVLARSRKAFSLKRSCSFSWMDLKMESLEV
jgi:hypothetical protein